ncbi:MAG: DUF296 domain-containing protein [Bacilli bacterium]|nr:DUF296 domain-containing protein [Bacilli bacterium]
MHIFRLTKGMDLKKSIIEYCKDNNIKAGIIGACVGCCYEIYFRLAGGKDFYHKIGDHEIVSMTGTISEDGVHIHVSFADIEGNVVGGHLSDGCYVGSTAEIAIIEVKEYKLTREFDESTGYKELVIEKIK